MPTYTITAPDGSKYRWKSEHTSKDAAIAEFRSQHRPQPPSQPAPRASAPVSSSGSLSRGHNPAVESVLQGLTWGASDEIQAALGAGAEKLGGLLTGTPVDFGQSYDRRQRAIQDSIEQHASQFPAASALGNLSGGLLGGSWLGGLAASPRMVGANIPNIIKLPALGAGSGVTAGAFSAPQGERFGGAVSGAVLGGALGGATVPVAAAANRLQAPATRMLRKVSEALTSDAVTPGQVRARLPKLGKGAVIADAAGDNVMGLARAAQSVPGKAKNRIASALYRRDRKQAERLMVPLERTLGDGRSFSASFDALKDLRGEMSAPLYAAVRDEPVRLTPELAELMERPSIRMGIDRARAIAADEGVTLPPALTREQGEEAFEESLEAYDGLPLWVWDYVKRGIDDALYGPKGDAVRHVDPFTRKVVTEQGRAIVGAKRALVDELDGQVEGYGAARGFYSGMTQSMQAMEDGAAFLKGSADLTVKQLAKLTDGDKAFFRLGVAQALRDMVERKGFTHDVTRLFDKPGIQRKLRAVFPDARSYREFMAGVHREARLSRTKSTVLGGSVTARLQEEQSDLMGDSAKGLAADLVTTGEPGMALGNAVRRLAAARRRLKLTPKENDELARILFSADPEEQAAILARLESPAAVRATFGPAAAVGGGNVMGIGINQ